MSSWVRNTGTSTVTVTESLISMNRCKVSCRFCCSARWGVPEPPTAWHDFLCGRSPVEVGREMWKIALWCSGRGGGGNHAERRSGRLVVVKDADGWVIEARAPASRYVLGSGTPAGVRRNDLRLSSADQTASCRP